MTRDEALAALKAGYAELTPGQKLEYRFFQPQDAPGVGRLFYQTYADSYPVDEPYAPDLLIEANRSRRFHTIVACAPDGSIAGHAAIYRSSPPNPRFYEYGQLMVDKAYRQTSAAYRLHRFAVEHLFGKAEGVDGIYGEAVCHHMATQKMIHGSGFVACGLELGLMPESAYAGEGVIGRASCLYAQRVDRDTPGPLFLPGEWGGLVQGLMGNWPLSRQVAAGDAEIPAQAASVMESRHFAFAGVRRVTVRCIGADFAARLAAELEAARRDGAVVAQVFLCLGEAWAGRAAQLLRQAGFFFCAYMPLWFGDTAPGPDAVMLQRFMAPASLAGLRLHTQEMQELGRRVVEDMERAAREFGAPEATILPVPE
ncbi:MAG TPA: GNAT family N-acetyltransferase [Humidesulfovibrio sp.]|uniref:GNAT family N-acetyltransferase n=1 Tax=Humidesulfovibrio sp. TaxID=2910988 RepID=UPI002C490D33|nr:GNAT family N-acetyltransferase [Humidesulfovibrio sp.]HWR03685.1 GNAT family N-acetyltransferase [Humidesulfovibrio sp.]